MDLDAVSVGMRFKVHPGLDLFMMGFRYGTVVKVGRKWVHADVTCLEVTRRVKLAGPDAGKSWARDCWCCGAPVIGPVWTLCDGCDGHGDGSDCDPEESWHCDRRAGHECDGTVCAEAAEEHERAERLREEAYGGMDPEHMTPL